MKTFLLLAAVLLSTTAHAAILGAPFIPEVDARFDNVEGNYSVNSSPGLHQKQIAVANFVFTAAAGSTITAPVSLPANALITRSYFWVGTAPVGVGASISVACQNAGNLLATTAVSAFPSASNPLDGVSTGASTVFKNITATCKPTATVTAAPTTAGNLTAYIEYVLHP